MASEMQQWLLCLRARGLFYLQPRCVKYSGESSWYQGTVQSYLGNHFWMYKAVPHEQVWAKWLFFFLFVCSVIYFQTVIDCIEDFVSQWCHCPVRGVQERRHFSCSEIGAFLTVVRCVSEGLSTIMCNITTTGWSQPGQDPHLFWHLLQRTVRVCWGGAVN